MSTPTPRTVHHVAPVPDSDVAARIDSLVHLSALDDAAEHLASIDATLARAVRRASVAGAVMAGATVIAAAALVIGEVRR